MTYSAIELRDFGRALLIASAGGVAFWFLGLPAPWLAGSMIAATGAALSGLRVPVPDLARRAVFVLLGIQIGASFSPATLSHVAKWPASLAVLAVTVVAVNWSGYLFYARLCGWDRPSAFFAANPGALSLTLLLAEHEGADLPRVTVVQCIRLFFLVMVLPPIIAGLGGYGGASPAPAQPPADLVSMGLMLAAGTLTGLAAERLKVPAGLILGAVLGVAVLELTGAVSGALPDWALIPGYVMLGLLIGARFAGFSLTLLRDLVVLGLAGFLVSLAVSTAGALAASALTGVSVLPTLIAFAPGGLEAMSLMAFALNLDPAFVGTHQIARYLGISVALPVAAAILKRRWRDAGD